MPASNDRARALARRLIALEESRPRASASAEAAPLEACYQLHHSLCHFVGAIGCEALAARALNTTALTHPVLAELRIQASGRPYFNGLRDAVRTHGQAAVATGVEAFLTSLLDLLVRFIGEEVVVALTEQTLHSEDGEDADSR